MSQPVAPERVLPDVSSRFDGVTRSALLCGVFIGVVWLALLVRFAGGQWLENAAGKTWSVADDIYISASFARTLVEGEGLRWYAGAPKVEGFTNPLWVLLLALFHVLPGFSEDRLGAFVFGFQVLAVASLAAVLCLGLARVARQAPNAPHLERWVGCAALAIAGTSLCVWSAQGFEVSLVALFASLAFVEGLRPPERIRTALVGVWIGLAFWTRMDAVLCCASSAALVLLRVHDRKRLLALALTAAAMIATLLLFRRAYYGDWFPNTYYLKISGWPLHDRLPFGLFQNVVALAVFALLLVPLAIFAWRRSAPEQRPALLALLSPVLTLLYSTSNGGDFVWRAFGYDRQGSSGAALLVLGLGAVLLAVRVQRWLWPLVAAAALAIAALPVLTVLSVEPGAPLLALDRQALRQAFDLSVPFRAANALDAELVYRGKLLRKVTRPGARIALCNAGAIIYFSRRGGVDVLGKVEPYVARLSALKAPPPERRCWRAFPPSGHNKEDVPGLFTLRRPELSDIEPPAARAADYVSFKANGRRFYALRGSKYVAWDKVSLKDRPRRPARAGRDAKSGGPL